ncbi:MAG TPA: hypothetical protein VHT94_15935 [Streptosporangiaceae bacterium]|nr:hypothetical protein [Streptosporangiaceae bacterium]
MTRERREALAATALLAAIAGAVAAQVLTAPSPDPAPVHAYLMPAKSLPAPVRPPVEAKPLQEPRGYAPGTPGLTDPGLGRAHAH